MYFSINLGVVAAVLLCLNVIGSPLKPGPGPIAITAAYMLSFAAFVFLRRYALFLQE